MNYFPFHLGDYAADTAHLEPMEDLAYRRMLDLYYRTEAPLPVDVQDIARLIRLRDHAALIRDVLNEFFTATDDGWRHSRCDAEIAKMQDKQAKAKASAQASVNARSANAQRTLNERSAKVELPTPTPTPTPTPKEEIAERVEPAPAPDLAGFSPTEAGLACRAMREAGMSAVNPGDPRLSALLRQGATVEELAGIAAEAAGKGRGFAWALKALEGRRTDAAAITPLPPRVAAPAGGSEPDWRRVQRERNEAFAGRFAAKHKPQTDGVVNVAARIVGE